MQQSLISNLASRAIMLSSANQISITKLDVRFPKCAGVQSIDELDSESKSFIKNIEDKLRRTCYAHWYWCRHK